MNSLRRPEMPSLVFPSDAGELIDYYAPKHYFGDAQIQFDDQRLMSVFFVTPQRIMQELSDPSVPAFIEKGLIVVREISLAEMEAAIKYAWKAGYFDVYPAMGDGEGKLPSER